MYFHPMITQLIVIINDKCGVTCLILTIALSLCFSGPNVKIQWVKYNTTHQSCNKDLQRFWWNDLQSVHYRSGT